MTQQDTQHDDQLAPDTQEPGTVDDPAVEVEGSESDDTSGQPDEALDPIAKLTAERDEFESRLLRVSADYQNFVRRSQQSTSDACQQQLIQLAKALLGPLDHFDHALAADPGQATTESVLQGVQIVRDDLLKVLDQFGVKQLNVEPGDEFDPVRHEALQRIEAEGIEAGAVAQQLQPGYVLGDKTLRPAKVVVAQ